VSDKGSNTADTAARQFLPILFVYCSLECIVTYHQVSCTVVDVHPVALLLVALICYNISPVIKLALCKSANTSKNAFYASATLRMAPKAFHFRVLCLCMYVCACLTYLINCLWQLHQIYNFGAFGHKYEQIGFWGRRSRSQQDHSWSNKHCRRHFLICLRNAWMYLNETYDSCLLPGPHDMMTLRVCGFKSQGYGQHFHFFLVKVCQLIVLCRRTS